MVISQCRRMVLSNITRTLPHTVMPHKIHQQRTFHIHHPFQSQKDHPTHHHTCLQSNGRNIRLRQSNKNLGNNNGGEEIWQLIQLTDSVLQHKTVNTTEPKTTTDAPARSRVPLYTKNSTQHMRSMTPPNTQIPQLSTQSVPRVDQSTKTTHKHQTKKHTNKFQATAPAHYKWSSTQSAKAPPASRTRALTQLTKLENKTQTGHASTVDADIAQLENDVHQYLAVMDTDTGDLLCYRQLMINPTF